MFVIGSDLSSFLAKTTYNCNALDDGDLDQLRVRVQAEGIEYLVSGCNERAYQVHALLAHERGLAGIDPPTASDANDSEEQFRKFAQEHGLSVARVYTFDVLPARVTVAGKPVDAYSGRGNTIVRSGASDGLGLANEHARSLSLMQRCLAGEEPEPVSNPNAESDRLTVDRISTNSGVLPEVRYNRFQAIRPVDFIEAFANYYLGVAKAMGLIVSAISRFRSVSPPKGSLFAIRSSRPITTRAARCYWTKSVSATELVSAPGRGR